MKKIVVGLLLVCLTVSIVFSGCKNEETNASDGKVSISVGYPKADESWKNDDYFRYITDKLNIDIDFQALSADSAGEKARIWISSGDMPDVVYSDFLLDEYTKYGQQGMVKPLPADWEKKYPNLGFSMAMTGALNVLKEAGNGEVYGLVRPLDHYSKFLSEFRAAYKEGRDLKEMMSENKYKYIDKYGFAYRKDWAKQLGIETDYIMEYDKFIDMVHKFKEADLGGVGAENTVGIAVDYTEAPNIFITAFNSCYKYFHRDESGKYVCGLLEDSTTEGVKAYAEAYRTGVISPGFYTQKTQDLNSLFCSQRSGVIFPKAEVSAMRELNAAFTKANPGMKAEDSIGVCWVLSPDGKIHGREAGNFHSAYYFNPKMSDEKFSKVLELADYVSSEEGGPQVRLGVPDVDFKQENGEYVILREKNANGTYDSLDKKYPSYEFFRNFLNPQYSHTVETDPYARACMDNLTEEKLKHDLSLLDWDVARDAYVSDDYVKFNAAYEVNVMFAEVVVSEGNIEDNWNKKRAEIEAAAKGVLENMNRAIG